METQAATAAFVQLVRAMIFYPDKLRSDLIEVDGIMQLVLKPDSRDYGLIIGKEGKNYKALVTLLRMVMHDDRILLVVSEGTLTRELEPKRKIIKPPSQFAVDDFMKLMVAFMDEWLGAGEYELKLSGKGEQTASTFFTLTTEEQLHQEHIKPFSRIFCSVAKHAGGTVIFRIERK